MIGNVTRYEMLKPNASAGTFHWSAAACSSSMRIDASTAGGGPSSGISQLVKV